MRAFTTPVAVFAFLSLLLIQPMGFADEATHTRGGRGAPVQGRTEGGTIPQPIKDWIASNFFLSPEFIEKQWGDRGDGSVSLPSALSRLKENNPDQIAKIVAELMGTTNPEIAKNAFASARAELIKRHANSDKPETKLESDFFEAMLFGFWAWPEKKEHKQAFCSEVLRKADEKAKADKVEDYRPASWASGDDGLSSLSKLLISKDGGKVENHRLADEEEKALFKSGEESCYSNNYDKFKQFKAAFDPAAKEVWEWNQQYHKEVETIGKADAKPEEKSAAFQNISEKTDGQNLTTYAFQQHLSGWKDAEGIDLGKAELDKAFRVLAGIQAGNKEEGKVRSVELVPVSGPSEKITWNAGEKKPSEVVAENSYIKEFLEQSKPPFFVPKGFDKPKPKTVAVASQPTGQPARTQPSGEGTSDTSGSQDVTVARQTNLQRVVSGIAEESIRPIVQQVGGQCIECHSAKAGKEVKELKADGSDFSKEVLAAGIQHDPSMLGYVKGLADGDKEALKAWAANLK